MEVQLSEKARETIENLVRDGGYATAEEAVEAAVGLLAERERERQDLQALLKEGIADIEAGRYIVLTPESVQELKKRIESEGRARLAAARNT